mmetsp:Transcript_36866/g.117401  ORF Transcript_36866/g.117401 Transcript_36866/m.117401 type:complete len:513 (+) Transcript_36866:574-2112(+)
MLGGQLEERGVVEAGLAYLLKDPLPRTSRCVQRPLLRVSPRGGGDCGQPVSVLAHLPDKRHIHHVAADGVSLQDKSPAVAQNGSKWVPRLEPRHQNGDIGHHRLEQRQVARVGGEVDESLGREQLVLKGGAIQHAGVASPRERLEHGQRLGVHWRVGQQRGGGERGSVQRGAEGGEELDQVEQALVVDQAAVEEGVPLLAGPGGREVVAGAAPLGYVDAARHHRHARSDGAASAGGEHRRKGAQVRDETLLVPARVHDQPVHLPADVCKKRQVGGGAQVWHGPMGGSARMLRWSERVGARVGLHPDEPRRGRVVQPDVHAHARRHLEPQRELRDEAHDDDVVEEGLARRDVAQPFGQAGQQLPLVDGGRDEPEPILVNKVNHASRAGHNVSGHDHTVAEVGDGRGRLGRDRCAVQEAPLRIRVPRRVALPPDEEQNGLGGARGGAARSDFAGSTPGRWRRRRPSSVEDAAHVSASSNSRSSSSPGRTRNATTRRSRREERAQRPAHRCTAEH